MTQEQRLIDYLSNHKDITALEAMNELGIMRLASRVSDLRRHGYQINAGRKEVTNRFGEKCRVAVYELAGRV